MVDFREGISMATSDNTLNDRLRSIESKLDTELSTHSRLQTIESKLLDIQAQHIMSKADADVEHNTKMMVLDKLAKLESKASRNPSVEVTKNAVFDKLQKLEAMAASKKSHQESKPTADMWLKERQRLSALQASL